MSNKSSSSHAEQVRQRRRTTRRTTAPTMHASDTPIPAYKPRAAYLPGDAHSLKSARVMRSATAVRKGQSAFVKGGTKPRKTRSKGNKGVAFSLGRTNVRAPALNLPHFSPRWISGGLTLLLGFMLYAMWTANTFIISTVDVSGNKRLATTDIFGQVGVTGEPIFKAIPSVIEDNLHTAFPDLQSVKVHLGLPNKVIINVVERKPVLAWYQDEAVTWIDANGVAFTPRGDVPGLIQVSAKLSPPKLPEDPNRSVYDQLFISPEMVGAFEALAPSVPAGITMTYDPAYGAGWQDPRGWNVYFGQDMKDMASKLQIYQSIVDTFNRQGIQPTIISVAYMDAPFYK